MNHCYCLVFNRATQVWQAVSEVAKSHTKSASKSNLKSTRKFTNRLQIKSGIKIIKKIIAIGLLPLLFSANSWADPALNTLPNGGQVVYGQSTISQMANTLNITQTSQKTIINWQSYNIGANATVNYVQPNSSAISLNRVTSQNPSAMFGKLNANGQVWLINPNGMLFGQGAQVNVGSLVASTLNITDADFLNSNYQFTGNAGSVINLGNLLAKNGGYIAMLAPEVRNEGVVSAMQGTASFATGDAITMHFNGDNLINVQVNSANINTLLENKNLIQVGNGQVLMGANAANNLITSVINNSGNIEANSMTSVGGVVRLTGAKTVINSGNISAISATNNGGRVHLLGENVGVFNNGSINVDGKIGGGTILVGGDYQGNNALIKNAQKTFISQQAMLSANSISDGDGGKVIVWADNSTSFYGNINALGGAQSGNGGLVEVSGKQNLNFIGTVNTSAINGVAGLLLLDPTDITISTGINSIESTGATNFAESTPTATSILNTTTLQNALALNNVTVTTASTAAGIGNITVANAINWSSNKLLTLTAANNIAINAPITTGVAGSRLILNATNNVTQTSAGIISGAGAVDKNGAGTATFGAMNTYTGSTTINTGTLVLGVANAIADTSTVSLLSLGAKFKLSGFDETVAAINGSGTIELGGNTLTTNATTSTTYGGFISGTGGLTKLGGGTLTLNKSHTYTGLTTVTAGTLVMGADNIFADTASILVNGGILSANTRNDTVANVRLDSGAITGSSGALTATSDFDLRDGAVSKGLAGNVNVNKTSTGTVSLTGNNSYTGATNINAGTLKDGAAIPNVSSVIIASGATLDLNNQNEIVGSIAGAGNIVMGTANLTSGADNTSTTFSGDISGSLGAFNKDGSGTLTLSGNNTYTGITNIRGGILSAASTNALGDAFAGTIVNKDTTLNVINTALAAEDISIRGVGFGGLGALTGTGDAITTGLITQVNDALIGTTDDTSILSISGVYQAAGFNLGIVGTGDLLANNVSNDFNVVNIIGNNVSLTDRNDLIIGNGASALTGNLSVNARGNIYVKKDITSDKQILMSSDTFYIDSGVNFKASDRWVVHTNSATARTNKYGDLKSENQAIWGRSLGINTPESGNRFVFIESPKLDVTSFDVNKTYGQDGALIVAAAYTATGFIKAFDYGDIFTQDDISNTLIGGASSAGSIVTANVGSYAVDLTPVAASTGYTINKIAAGSLTVNPAALTITANDKTTTYGDGVSFSGTDFTSSGLQNSETIGSVVFVTGAGGSVNVGNYAITGNNASGGTFNASNYAINYVNGVYTVNPAIINLAGVRNYDTTINAGAVSFGSINGVFGQTLTLAGNGLVSSKNVGLYNGFDTGSLALKLFGVDATNYTLAGGTHSFIINQALLNLSAVTDAKVYDGNTNSTAAVLIGNAGFNGILTGDTISNVNQSFTNKNVLGSNGSSIIVNNGYVINDGNGGNNYLVSQLGITGTITPKTIFGSITANDKTYDTNNTATIASRLLTGVIGSEVVNYVGGSATFAESNAGIAKTVTATGLSISGADAANYSVNTAATTLANINPRALTGSITVGNKTYDGNNSATINGRSIMGVLAGDTITYTGAGNATFNDKNADIGKIVTSTGFSLSGINTGNYTVNSTATTTADITPASLTITASNQSKTYGDTFTFAGNAFASSGLIAGETIGNVNVASLGAINTANVNFYPIVASAASGGSFDANNYTINYSGGNFTVNHAIINLAASRSYNATTIFNGSDFGAVNGLFGQLLNVNGAGAVASKNAGAVQTLLTSSLTLNGAAANNYTLAGGTHTGTVTQTNLVLNAFSDSKTYDGTTNLNALGPIGSIGIAGLFSPDTVTASISFVSKDALGNNGSTLNINAGYVVDDGNNGNNYNVITNSATGTISKANLNVVPNSATKTQGTANPTFTSQFIGLVNGETSAVVTGALGYNTLAEPASTIGTYAVSPFGLSATNYNISFIDGTLIVQSALVIPPIPNPSPNITVNGITNLLNSSITRPEQAVQVCNSNAANGSAMINGLDAFGLVDVDYQASISQPLLGGVVANAFIKSSCSKL